MRPLKVSSSLRCMATSLCISPLSPSVFAVSSDCQCVMLSYCRSVFILLT
jgi:hypothetical protein